MRKKPSELDFEEYIRQVEPAKREKSYAWSTAIGLQQVDGLTPSDYLLEVAKKNIEGKISLNKAQALIDSYYESKTEQTDDNNETEEADKVSVRTAQILSEKAFSFSPFFFTAIHKRLFDRIFKHAGEIRKYNISKKEWVLNGDSVMYGASYELRMALDYDFDREREFNYSNLSMDEIVRHLSSFVSSLWQIHAFGEGNTRTTAVFTIKYLRSMGFKVGNDIFAKNSWYFRNALVRANYKNVRKGIQQEPEYLEKFFRNLLMGEHNELKNRYMLINPPKEWKKLSRPEQVPEQVPNKLYSDTPLVIDLIKVIGPQEFSISQLMKLLKLKHRPNFLEYHLKPSVQNGFVCMKYPDSPHHPRQKYLLTVKGLALYNELTKNL